MTKQLAEEAYKLKRCKQCMEPFEQGIVCPHCGFDNSRPQEIPYALPPGYVLHGKYQIGNVLGQGGFGITYIGFDMILETKVAIKEYYVSSCASRVGSSDSKVYWMSDPGDMNHFITEARRMAKLSRMPEIAHVIDIFYDNKTAYIIMEYVEGVSLEKHLHKTGILSFEDTVKLMLPVIRALGQIHEKGIIHRDISPDNLMMEPNGRLRILDLGAAGDASKNEGQASQLVARQGFSPPEQYSGSVKFGPWTDVYAVCATIHYCCTGRLIPNAHERMDRFVHTKKVDLTFDERIPPAGAKVLQKGLALDAKNRIGSMAALEELLKRSLEKPTPVIPDFPKIRKPNNINTKEPAFRLEKERIEKVLREKLKKIDLSNVKKPLMIGAAAVSLVAVIGIGIAMGSNKPQPSPAEEAATRVIPTAEPKTEATEPPLVLKIQETLTLNDVDWGQTAPVTVLSGPVAKDIQWSSSNPNVAAVNAAGVVTAAGQGKAEITAEYQGQTTKCAVTVVLRPNVTCKYKKAEMADGNFIRITGYEGEKEKLPEVIVLPSKIDGLPVKTIASESFQAVEQLKSVVIPENVTTIAAQAFFSCTGLEKVILPSGLESIGSQAFYKCKNLHSIQIPQGVKKIADDAFGETGLAEIEVDNGNSSYCSKDGVLFSKDMHTLVIYPPAKAEKKYSIPDGVVTLERSCFRKCVNLESIRIPSSVKTIFYSDSWKDKHSVFSTDFLSIEIAAENPEFCVIDGILFTKDMTTLIKCPAGNSFESYTVPDTVTSIAEYAFENCRNLMSVTIPDNLLRLHATWFVGCSNLESISVAKDCLEYIPYAGFDDGYLSGIVHRRSESQSTKKNTGGNTKRIQDVIQDIIDSQKTE